MRPCSCPCTYPRPQPCRGRAGLAGAVPSRCHRRFPRRWGRRAALIGAGPGGTARAVKPPPRSALPPSRGLVHGASLPWGPRSLPAKRPRGAPAPLRPLPALRCRLPGRGVLFAVRLMSEPHSGRFPDGGERADSGRPGEASLPPLPPPPARRCRGLALGGGTGKSWFQFAL